MKEGVAAPTITMIQDPTVSINTTATFSFTVDDVDDPGIGAGDLIVTVDSSDYNLLPLANIVLGGSGTDRTVTITPAADLLGFATVTLTVDNGIGGTASSAFFLTVALPGIVSISPVSIGANGPDFPLTVDGSGFVDGFVVRWNGANLVTTFTSDTELVATVPAAKIALAADLATALVTVANPVGGESSPLVITITGAKISAAQTSMAGPGFVRESASTAPSDGTSAGVGATLLDFSSPTAIVLTAATYNSNPVGGNIIDVGGGYVDLRLTGANPTTFISASFYYPKTVASESEAGLTLLYFDVTANSWTPVVSSGGQPPLLDTGDDLDGTVSGGRFNVAFDDTSTPKVTELTGTVFSAGLAQNQATPVITWAAPAGIVYGTILDGTQLNAGADTPGAFAYTPASGTVLHAGDGQTLSVTFTPFDTANYKTVTSSVTINVAKAILTVTADDQAKVYGASLPALTLSYLGFVNTDTQANLRQRPRATTTGKRSSPVGTYPITLSGGLSANYNFNLVPGTLTVTAAALTITAADKSNVYGTALPALTAIYSGFVNGDNRDDLATPVILTTATTISSGTGTYPITASGASSANYIITYVDGNLTVTPHPLTIRAQNKSKVYGEAIPALTAGYSGLVNGDTLPVALSTTATASSDVGTYPITVPVVPSSPNYIITFLDGTLTVTPHALTIRADSKPKIYGDVMPTLTASYIGFVNGDNISTLESPVVLGCAENAATVVGDYPITASGAVAHNYVIHFVAGILDVDPAPLTIRTDNISKIYGDAVPQLTYAIAGFVLGESEANLASPVIIGTTGAADSSVGSYPILVSGASSANYTIRFVRGTLSVTRAPLTITADDKTRARGQANPPLTATYTGFVNGDTAASLDIPVTLTTTAKVTSVAGVYPIKPSAARDSNYSITFVNGALTVTP